ncbi:hypothetical protein [Methylobacter tundripaludum]|uniref:hypothetical protein n=1 Tax=Methylobacter tundripaludum TaxID=173365 RepID=UPI001C258144|nr:hypothetical protein [Methylobacter tundripaludum]
MNLIVNKKDIPHKRARYFALNYSFVGRGLELHPTGDFVLGYLIFISENEPFNLDAYEDLKVC